jgi:hypothetical protein
MDNLTAADVADEDWSAHDKFPKERVVCVSGHGFHSHSKFSGRLIAIISREACPQCGTHSLQSAHSGRESQTISNKDVGNA